MKNLVSLGYKGGYDAVRRYARTWRRRWPLLLPSQAFVPLSFDPGEAYQFDWSHEYARLAGATTRVKAAHMWLCHSRMYLVQIFPRESQEMVFEAHERAFRFFGGGLPAGHLRQHEDGACSADVVLNILARQCQPPPPAIPTPEGLQLRHQPVADCRRYDRLRKAGHGAL